MRHIVAHLCLVMAVVLSSKLVLAQRGATDPVSAHLLLAQKAIANDDTETLGKVLNTPYVLPNDRLSSGQTLLESACVYNKAKVIKFLLDHGADPLYVNVQTRKNVVGGPLVMTPLAACVLNPQLGGNYLEGYCLLLDAIVHNRKNWADPNNLGSHPHEFNADVKKVFDGLYTSNPAPILLYLILKAPNDGACSLDAVSFITGFGANPNPDFHYMGFKGPLAAAESMHFPMCVDELRRAGSKQ